MLVLTGTGLQTPSWSGVPARAPLPCDRRASKRTGQDFTARMIAAEALSPDVSARDPTIGRWSTASSK